MDGKASLGDYGWISALQRPDLQGRAFGSTGTLSMVTMGLTGCHGYAASSWFLISGNCVPATPSVAALSLTRGNLQRSRATLA